MAAPETTQATIDRANELYWGTDRSVNQIADELDLSKGALYGMIRPLPAGLGCPDCGGEIVSPNRTARERGMFACAVCGWEGDDGDAISYGGEGAVTLPAMAGGQDVVAEAPTVDSHRNRILAGGALLGAAAGLALVLWTRRSS